MRTIIFVLLFVASIPSWSDTLSTTQYATLKAHALTVPAMVTAISNGDDVAIRDYFNSPGTLYGWRTNITPTEYREALVWTEIDALSVGRARIWDWVTMGQTESIDAGKVNIRNGIANAFAGAQASGTRNALLAIASAIMTIAEEQLVVVDGSAGTQADAKTKTFSGLITTQQASLIRVSGD